MTNLDHGILAPIIVGGRLVRTESLGAKGGQKGIQCGRFAATANV